MNQLKPHISSHKGQLPAAVAYYLLNEVSNLYAIL